MSNVNNTSRNDDDTAGDNGRLVGNDALRVPWIVDRKLDNGQCERPCVGNVITLPREISDTLCCEQGDLRFAIILSK